MKRRIDFSQRTNNATNRPYSGAWVTVVGRGIDWAMGAVRFFNRSKGHHQMRECPKEVLTWCGPGREEVK